VAFCGGIDLSVDRWDTPEHVDRSKLRQTQNRRYGPRHDVTTAVDGAAARALAEVARYRWEWATAQSLPPLETTHTVWPPDLSPSLRDVDVAVARTFPELNERNEIREIEALNLAAIAAARRIIYLENQYLASRVIADALCARLREDDGPEVVIVMPRTSESLLEQQAMDSARHRLLKLMWDADRHGRLGVYWPETDGGTPVYVHSKVLAVDDRLLRIGSSNLNNRSMGFDSECDVAIEADPDDVDRADVGRLIATVRAELLSEHLGVSTGVVRDAARRHGSFIRAIEVLRGKGRTLRPFTARIVADEASLFAENDLMDPDRVPKSVTRSVQRWIDGFAE
jgi:phosphatidylserine/phosphatidylglycerophosphate/cardiolipin synthase-like enzyme